MLTIVGEHQLIQISLDFRGLSTFCQGKRLINSKRIIYKNSIRRSTRFYPGSIIFQSLYVCTFTSIIHKNSIDFHPYAEETQFYIGVDPDDLSPFTLLKTTSLTFIYGCQKCSLLQPNQDKTEITVMLHNGTERMTLIELCSCI